MIFSVIIQIALNYFLLGVIALAFIGIIFGIGYFIIYKKLLEGKFNTYSLSNKIDINDIKLTCIVDSKGFSQPVYQFTLEDENMGKILIPALKQ